MLRRYVKIKADKSCYTVVFSEIEVQFTVFGFVCISIRICIRSFLSFRIIRVQNEIDGRQVKFAELKPLKVIHI